MIDFENLKLYDPVRKETKEIGKWIVLFATPLGLLDSAEAARERLRSSDLPTNLIRPIPCVVSSDGSYYEIVPS